MEIKLKSETVVHIQTADSNIRASFLPHENPESNQLWREVQERRAVIKNDNTSMAVVEYLGDDWWKIAGQGRNMITALNHVRMYVSVNQQKA